MQVHPSQISPGEPFDVFYFIRNHTDGTTYYVQAKVYDVQTGELLATENLTQSPTNDRLFIKRIQSPPDPTGYGRNIVAIATVYTDSGYTTKSDNYEEQEQYYLIKSVLPFLGGGGGADIADIKEAVRDIVKSELAKLPKPEKAEIPAMPWESLFGAVGALQREINRIPKESIDLAPLLAALAQIRGLVASLPPPQETDLTPLRERIDALEPKLTAALGAAARQLLASHDVALERFTGDFAERADKALSDLLAKQQLTIPIADLISKRPAKEEEPDISHLVS